MAKTRKQPMMPATDSQNARLEGVWVTSLMEVQGLDDAGIADGDAALMVILG